MLRFRDDAQHDAVKATAKRYGLSLNEWLLGEVDAGLKAGRRGDKLTQGAQDGVAKKSRSVPPSKEKDSAPVSAVGGRKNGAVAVSAKAGGACPNCGRGLVPWGAMMRCQDCKRNYAK